MADASFSDFVAALAAKTPAPGGGAAAARAAAMGAALGAMVLRFSVDKPANAARAGELAAALVTVEATIARVLPLDERDMAAFTRVLAAYKLPKDGAAAPARDAAIQSALHGAMAVPAELCTLARDALAALEPVADCIGRNIVADLATAAELLLAAARAARLMVAINARGLSDRAAADAALASVDAALRDVAERRDRLARRADSLLV